MRATNFAVLAGFAALACGCSLLQSMAEPFSQTVADPEVQAAAGGVIRNVITGNWLGAAASLGELIAVAGGTWKAVNMSRDRRRRQGTDVKAGD